MKTAAAGLIFDDSRHYIDHLGPFCALQEWPLIVCEGEVADLARRYYPNLEIIEMNRWDLKLPRCVVACDPRSLIDSVVPSDPNRKLLWLPHGNSDKGWKTPIFEPLHKEIALVYGQKMIDFMHKQGVFPEAIRIGNFRCHYWMQNQRFYEKILKEEICLPKAETTYLYAPTWNDPEGNSSFWDMLPRLTSSLPDESNLIVKIHPNTQMQFAPKIERLIGQYAKRKNIYFLTEFPPIYPLLSMCDVYIGDMSSIGYDFLYRKCPMYFLINERAKQVATKGASEAMSDRREEAGERAERSQFLYRCGMEISPDQIDLIFKSNPNERKAEQEQVYHYTFDSYSPLSEGSTNTTFKSFRQQAVGRASIS